MRTEVPHEATIRRAPARGRRHRPGGHGSDGADDAADVQARVAAPGVDAVVPLHERARQAAVRHRSRGGGPPAPGHQHRDHRRSRGHADRRAPRGPLRRQPGPLARPRARGEARLLQALPREPARPRGAPRRRRVRARAPRARRQAHRPRRRLRVRRRAAGASGTHVRGREHGRAEPGEGPLRRRRLRVDGRARGPVPPRRTTRRRSRRGWPSERSRSWSGRSTSRCAATCPAPSPSSRASTPRSRR